MFRNIFLVNNIFNLNYLSKVANYKKINFHNCARLLAGHSKWANIKHTKALKDSQRSLLFVKQARIIRLAIQEGGGSPNPALNTHLKTAIEEATRRNMPGSTIQNVLKKATAQSAKLKRYLFEIKAVNRIFIVCIVYTDNFAGSRMLLSPILKKNSAVMTDTSHMFYVKGIVEVFGGHVTEKVSSIEELENLCTEHAIECGAEEIEIINFDNRHLSFSCDVQEIEKVKQKLQAIGYSIENAEHCYIPNVSIQLNDAEQTAYAKLKEKLLNFDGIEEIYDNVDILEDA